MKNAEEWADFCQDSDHPRSGLGYGMCLDCAQAYARECVEPYIGLVRLAKEAETEIRYMCNFDDGSDEWTELGLKLKRFFKALLALQGKT